ncbi:MAG: phytanoyl-CoA dioxygenase family protein [Chloroflexota bacterium]
MLTDLDNYLFDLRGYLLLEGALSPEEVAALNAGIDAILPINAGEWDGYIYVPTSNDKDGITLQQIYEGGAAFEKLIDHPSWTDKVKHFIGGEGTFDYSQSPLFIDENFANIRGIGEAIPVHSGGHEGVKRTQFRYRNGKFMCGQINILMALTDIGPGDGATMVIPGSHKANFPHPQVAQAKDYPRSADGLLGAIEVHMKAGDALLFVDSIMHGSARRTNEGERRIIVYRYGPGWGNFRYGYQVSPELLARLTPQQRKFVQPLPPMVREPQRKRQK